MAKLKMLWLLPGLAVVMSPVYLVYWLIKTMTWHDFTVLSIFNGLVLLAIMFVVGLIRAVMGNKPARETNKQPHKAGC
jgi:uncharacterized membrane protein